jgi:GGDEF domain-containing protein
VDVPGSDLEAERAWEELLRERSHAARRRTELLWLRRLAASSAADSLETLLRRVLEAAADVGGAAAAMLVLPQGRVEPLVVTFGLTAEECSRELLGLPPSAEARAVSLSYRYSEEEAAQDEFRLTGGLALPVPAGPGERLGTLAVLWRRVEHRVTDEELERLEGLAGALEPVLSTAFRVEDLRRELDLDPDTQLRGRRTLHRVLEAECARARRYERPLALLLLEAPERGDPAALRTAASRLGGGVRLHDLLHYAGEGVFAAVLPESTAADATRLLPRLELALGPGASGLPRSPLLTAVAELRPEDDAVALLARAEETLARTRARARERPELRTSAVEPGG